MKNTIKKFIGIAAIATMALGIAPGFSHASITEQLTPEQKWELKTRGEVTIEEKVDEIQTALPGVQRRTKYYSVEQGGWKDLGWAYYFRTAGTINKNVWTGVSPYTCNSWTSDTNPYDTFTVGVKQIRVDDSSWDAESAWCGR